MRSDLISFWQSITNLVYAGYALMVHHTTVINLKKYLSAVMTNTLDAIAQLTTAIIKVRQIWTGLQYALTILLTDPTLEREAEQQLAYFNGPSLALLHCN